MKAVLTKIIIVFFVLSIFIQFNKASLYASEIITFGFAHKPSQDPQYMFYKNIYTEAFKELGYEFQYKVLPSKRSSQMLENGVIDGEPQRIYKYATFYSNIVRVEEPIFINRTLAFTINPDIYLSEINSLKNTKFRVDYLRGSKWSKNKLEPLVLPNNLTPVKSVKHAFRKLVKSRTDIIIALEVYALNTLAKDEFKNSNILSLGVMGSNRSYPYLNKSHSNIALGLSNILKKMKKDGRYNKILKESMPFIVNE